MKTHFVASLVMVALVALVATAAQAVTRLPSKEWRPGIEDPLLRPMAPVMLRISSGTTWVRVHEPEGSPCEPADVAGSPEAQTTETVWCFEGAGGDSTWPAVPPGQDTGSNHEDFDHWSWYAPPIAPPSKWHVTTRHENPNEADTYNAWAGCDSLNSSGVCDDIGFWVHKDGYGNLWNFPLELDASGQDANSGGEIKFDLRYDTECDYDYLYLEYLDTVSSLWAVVVDSVGTSAVFNSISGNPDTTEGGTGRDCGEDIYHHSDERILGGPDPELYHGNSIWLEEVRFPMPAQTGGLKLRWRARSDQYGSDEDGQYDMDSDGIAAIDNVRIEFAASGVVVSDDFETGDFDGITATSGSASWIAHGQLVDEQFNTYDGWHLAFDPMYRNKGNTCTFSDDWIWAAKPETGAIPPEASGFAFYLVSPIVDTHGWTGGVFEFSEYMCMPAEREVWTDTRTRVYDSEIGAWSDWNGLDGFIISGGCEFWNRNQRDDVSSQITATVDSLQFAWITRDDSDDGTFGWGKHGGVQYLIDNVSIGSFDGTATIFTIRNIDIFADTFSRSDPAHSPFLQNNEMGQWSGIAGRTRDFTEAESLSVDLTDFNGITASNVHLWWRHDDGGAGFGSWNSKPMDFSSPEPTSTSDEGTYRQIIGNDLGGTEDPEGTPGNGLIWKAATTVEYYVKVLDNSVQEAVLTELNGENPFEFSVLPFGNTTTNGNRILLVDDYTRTQLDFEKSTGFNPTGGAGFGGFSNPTRIEPEFLVTDALGLIYEEDFQAGAGIVDKYDVQGGGSSVQCEPRGVADEGNGLGGFMNGFGVPTYDAVIWMQGTFDQWSYADTTRLELKTFIENGGHLLSNGDEVSFHLGTGGNNADSAITFLGDYLGTSFPNEADDATEDRVLDVVGEPGSEYAGYLCGIYGECPLRRAFDRLTLAMPPTLSENRVLFRYTNGTANDNGRPGAIYNQRFADEAHTLPQGDAINFGFGFSALPSRVTIAAILDVALHDIFGLTDPGYDPVDVPGVSLTDGFAFRLAPAAPNPFRSSTSISFSVAKRTHVSIDVFNVLGQKVRTIVDEALEPNSYVRTWDGRSDDGLQVSSGIYFYKMVADDFSETKKAVVLR